MMFASKILDFAALTVCSSPVHLLSFSTLLGTQLYQTFIITKICYKMLPRPAFIRLQSNLFPAYFRIQTSLVLLTAVTFPPSGPLSLTSQHGWIPLAMAGTTAALNLMVYGPRTNRAMLDLRDQGKPFLWCFDETTKENRELPTDCRRRHGWIRPQTAVRTKSRHVNSSKSDLLSDDVMAWLAFSTTHAVLEGQHRGQDQSTGV